MRTRLLGTLILTGGVTAAAITGAVALDAPGDTRNAQASAASQVQAAKRQQNLFLRYVTAGPCTVYLNYPKSKVKGNGHPLTVPAGQQIIWRYNIDAKRAMISIPARAHNYPWWGVTDRSCIGKSIRQWLIREKTAKGWKVVKRYPAGRPIPNRIKQGRSNQADGWRKVYFPETSARIVARHQQTHRNATLRDRHNFVIGNVPANWHVNVSSAYRSGRHWVKVYVPNAKRWGYIESSVLH
ncbi:hypothetical protein [Actinomadura macra]|uniref:hypothetical protein n=1 Tax=Actinomadura macra TaxID=46164 RepID=UPI000AC144A3|nr:hypothetical protein [Actinomadura macra]